MIEQFYDLKPQVLELDRKTLELCRDQFAHLEEIRDYNQLKMLCAFTDCGVEARHFLGSAQLPVSLTSRSACRHSQSSSQAVKMPNHPHGEVTPKS